MDEQLREKKNWIGSRYVWNEDVCEFWKREDDSLDVTVVIPINSSVYISENAYQQAKDVFLLSNGCKHPTTSNAKVICVPWDGHSQTRKRIRDVLQTKYVFFSVQDAYPVGDMLKELVQEMERGEWDIVMPRQIPWPDCAKIDRDRIRSWTPNHPQVYSMPHADHVGALYRSEDVQQWSLPNVSIAEDVWWSIGRRVACVPWARIVHSHRFSCRDIFQRERAIHSQLQTLGLLAPPSWKTLFYPLFAEKGMKKRAFAESLGQFIGWLEQ